MASAKQTAKTPEDLEVGEALAEVEAGSKVANKAASKLLAGPNSTFAQRAKVNAKRIGSASNKAVKPDDTEAK